MSRTAAPIPIDLVDVPSCSTHTLGDIGNDIDFEDEITSLTSKLATGVGSLDITLQTAVAVFSTGEEENGRLCIRTENLQV